MDDFDESDPTADFLARERAVLGEAARDFDVGTAKRSTATEGVVSPPPGNDTGFDGPPAMASLDDEPLGSVDATTHGGPALLSPSVAPPETAGPLSSDPLAVTGSNFLVEEEPEALREWRETFERQIADHESRVEADHQGTLEKARREIDRFYDEYNDKKAKAIEKNRQLQQRLLDEQEKDENEVVGVWERICRLLDFPKQAPVAVAPQPSMYGGMFSKGLDAAAASLVTPPIQSSNRMREVLISLREDGNAPTGAGLPALPETSVGGPAEEVTSS